MTTMNRMVEERRTQIGVLKALGYSKPGLWGNICFMRKYGMDRFSYRFPDRFDDFPDRHLECI